LTSVDHTERESPTFSSRLRLAPLAIWSVHASLCYGVVAIHCHLGDIDEEVIGRTAVRVLLYVITAVAFAVALAVVAISYRAWEATLASGDPNGRRGFTAGFTAIAACAVLLYLVWAVVLISAAELC
jgi:hypothetical protein